MIRHLRLFTVLLLLVFIGLVGGNIVHIEAQGSPTKPILVVVNDASSNPFGRYLGEILLAEGLNSFDVSTISNVNVSTLGQYQVVVLAETTLTAAQASSFATYMTNGGYLIAMRPDSQIAGLFNLGAVQGTQTDGYMKMSGIGPSQGLSTVTLQFHGVVDRYSSAGAVTLAQLYNSATTSTTYPAVAQSANGHGTAFLYDLAKSVVYTRQGNPANANVDVDGDGVLRSIDLFYSSNGTSWVDKDKMPIPQADEQQRFFARLVVQGINAYQPMPQMWYFPGTSKTVLISTADAHANPVSWYQDEINTLNAHNAKATFYLSIGGGLINSTVQSWRSQGHEFGIHPYWNKPDSYPPYNITSLSQGFDVYSNWFAGTFTSPASRTVRDHQVAWSGWTDAAEIAIAHGMKLDANFYNWGPWLKKTDGSWAHGYLTGSGQSMKFMKADGTILPYYQQLTQLVDEQMFQVDPGYSSENLTAAGANQISQQLINGSEAGDYAAIMTQFHVDYFSLASGWVDGTLAYAQSKGIPMWNADTWLNFTQTRHDATYTNFIWNSGTKTLNFNMVASSSPSFNLSTVLPLSYGGSSLQYVTVDGNAATISTQTIKGTNVAFVTVPSGNHIFAAAYSGNGVIPTSTLTFTPTDTGTTVPSSTPTITPTQTPSTTPNGSVTPTFTFTPPPNTGFPSTNVLDSFTRANGAIGSNWSSSTNGYTVATNTLDVGGGGDVYWSASPFGANQEAYVTLNTLDTGGREIDLVLKSQSNTGYGGGLLEVLYDPVNHVVQVWTFTVAQDWVKRGTDVPVTFVNGDQFGARATATGQVNLYRNGVLLGTRDITAWSYAANGGYIGMWVEAAANTVLDDFGGGSTASGPLPSNTPTSTFTPSLIPSNTPSFTPTSTFTPTFTPSNTATFTPTLTPSNTPTSTFTPSNTPTRTPSNTATFTLTPSNTPSLTPSNTATFTLTPSDTPIVSFTPSDTPVPSNTPTSTLTPSNTPSNTPVPSNTPSRTPTAMSTLTQTPSATPTLTPTSSGNTFPSTTVLDTFTRANGTLGGSWAGAPGGYAIASNQVDVNNGGNIFWAAAPFGSNQEVFVTLTTVDASGVEIDLLLKSQNPTNTGSGALEVWYNPLAHVVEVWSYTSAQNWVQRGADLPVTFVNGDVFGARATSDGQVSIYRNGTLVGTRDVRSWPLYTLGGYIGMWYDRASNSFFDNFGGGSVVP